MKRHVARFWYLWLAISLSILFWIVASNTFRQPSNSLIDPCLSDVQGVICYDAEGNKVAYTPWPGSLQNEQGIGVATNVGCEILVAKINSDLEKNQALVTYPASLYSGPDANYEQVGIASCGQVYPVVAKTYPSGFSMAWYLIELPDGDRGWLSGYLVRRFNDDGIPLATTPTPET